MTFCQAKRHLELPSAGSGNEGWELWVLPTTERPSVEKTDLKPQIQCLVQLQNLDIQIYALNNEKAAKPEQVRALELEFESKKQHLQELEKKALDLQKLKKDRELELGSKEDSAKKLQQQLYQLKTNKEYQSMLQQIQGAKADTSLIEEKILEVMVAADNLKLDLDQEKQRLQAEEKKLAVKKKELQDRVKEIDDRLAQLNAQRAQIVPGIEPAILKQYDRILSSREGLAIVLVKNNSCQGCNMSTPPQVINLIKMYETIITCEVCNRILYIE